MRLRILVIPLIVFAVVVTAAMLILRSGSGPATFTVDSTADAVDVVPGDGDCFTAVESCTLRAAIMETNALAGPDKIFVPAGTYVLDIAGYEDAAAAGDLDITDDLIIGGAGAPDTVVDATISEDRVFHVLPGVTAEIASLTITGGSAAIGGGILNVGSLELDSITVTKNTASGVGGGGIYNSGTLTVSLSTVSENAATISSGGAIDNEGILSMENSTISGNTAATDGGGIFNGEATVNLNNVTITNNEADSDTNASGAGGGVYNAFGSVFSRNTIIAANTIGPPPVAPALTRDCSGIITSQGHNLVGNGTDCTWTTNLGDLVGTITQPAVINPQFGPLDYNDGLTKTHQIPATSPAADAGSPGLTGGGCTEVDQRLLERPKDADYNGNARCEIGAYELGSLSACLIPDEPLPLAGCSRYSFTNNILTVTAPDLGLFGAGCPVDGMFTTQHDALAVEGLATPETLETEITSFSGYVYCPGPIGGDSSIVSGGTITENQNNIVGELEFPATGSFVLCLEIYTTTVLGTIANCPDSFAAEQKSPIVLDCFIPTSLNSYDCTIASPGATFFNASKTPVASVDGGTLNLEVPSSIGGVAELPEVADAPLQETESSGRVGLFTVLLAALTAAVALGGAAWYAYGRRSR